GGTNLRFVVTNLPAAEASPADWPSDPVARLIYDDYTQRGESEHRMDELKNGLHADRLSCHRFMANFFRLLLHTAAYNLFNAVRDSDRLPEVLRVGQPGTWHLAAAAHQGRRRDRAEHPAHRRAAGGQLAVGRPVRIRVRPRPGLHLIPL